MMLGAKAGSFFSTCQIAQFSSIMALTFEKLQKITNVNEYPVPKERKGDR